MADLLRDPTLLAGENRPSREMVADEKVAFFAANSVSPVSEVALEQYSKLAQGLAARASERLDTLLPCASAAGGEAACAAMFIERFGMRAYRRPLLEEEKQRALTLYNTVASKEGFKPGIAVVIEAMLQSPFFLYRFEEGVGGSPGGSAPLSDYQIASRLSYFVWRTMPDDQLFAAAAASELRQPAGLRRQAQRLLGSDRADVMLADFHTQWLDVQDLGELTKGAPEFTDAVRKAGSEELPLFLKEIFQGSGSLKDLLTAPYTFANDVLAGIYGVAGVTGSEMRRVGLEPTKRAGVLTQIGLLATHSVGDQSSPVHRGLLVRERLLCQEVAALPDKLADMVAVPEPNEAQSTRERFEQHRSNPDCAACHALMDPIGFSFEHYDAIGRYRVQDGRHMVDAKGQLTGTDVDGNFYGAVELAQRLATSSQVGRCLVRTWFSFAFGRDEEADDQRAIDALDGAFQMNGRNLKQLILALATSEAFRVSRAASP